MAKEVKKEQNIDGFQSEIEKIFGKGSIITANEEIPPGDIIPLTSLTLCNALGKGGFAKNKIIEIIGWESAGKSTLSCDAIANDQKTYGDNCLLIDKENSFDKFYAERLGVNLDKLQLAYPNSLEDCYSLIEKALDSRLFGLIVVDSLTSFQPQASLDNPGGAMGKEARINSDRMRMVTDKVRNSNCCVVFINQIREKIGVMFGSPETTSGGNALKFYAHVRIMIRRKEIKAENQTNTMHFKIIKNKLAPPMKEAETTIIWGKGFDKESEIFYLAKDFEIIKKHGKKVTYNGEIFELSDKDAMDEYYAYLDKNPDIKKEIVDKVLDRLNNPITEEENGQISEEKVL